MTVKQVIAALSEYPQDMTVMIQLDTYRTRYIPLGPFEIRHVNKVRNRATTRHIAYLGDILGDADGEPGKDCLCINYRAYDDNLDADDPYDQTDDDVHYPDVT